MSRDKEEDYRAACAILEELACAEMMEIELQRKAVEAAAAAKAKAAADKAAAEKAAAEAAAAALLQGQKETAFAAWQAILAASYAAVYAADAKHSYDDTVEMSGNDCFAAFDGSSIGVFETADEARTGSAGATKIAGFCDIEYATMLCKLAQGGPGKWDNFLPDDTVYEAEEDDDDSDSDSDSDSDDDGPKKPKWPYKDVKKGFSYQHFNKKETARLLVEKKRVLKFVHGDAASGNATSA